MVTTRCTTICLRRAKGAWVCGRYLYALQRYKWLILLLVIAGTALGLAITRFMVPQYFAQATIWIEPQGAGERDPSGPIRSPGLLQGAILDRAYAVGRGAGARRP